MTFKECFIKCLKDRGHSDKQITLALMSSQIDGDGGHDDKTQITPEDEQGMNALLDVLLQIPQNDLIAGAERIRRKNRRMN